MLGAFQERRIIFSETVFYGGELITSRIHIYSQKFELFADYGVS